MSNRAPVGVSIVVPCYNAGATIGETIDSALSQGAQVEVIVIDDGSTDTSAEAIRRFGDRILTHFGPNQGVSAARNTGVAMARGAWILFLDSDDLLEPRTVEARQALAFAQSADVVICDWEDFGETIDPVRRGLDPAKLDGDLEAAILSGLWAPPAAVLYRRSLVDRIGGFRGDLPVIQDARYLFDAAHLGARFVHLPEVGARYRVVEGSLSRRSPARFWRDVLLSAQQIEELWRADATLDAARGQALAAVYDQTARSLFLAADPSFADAVVAQRRFGPGSRFTRAAHRLSSLIGLPLAHKALALAGFR